MRNAQFFCFRDIHFHFVVPSLKKSEKCAIFFVLRAYTPATPVTTQDFKDPNFRLPQPLLKNQKLYTKKFSVFFYFFVLWLNLRCPRNSKFCYKVTAHSFIIQKNPRPKYVSPVFFAVLSRQPSYFGHLWQAHLTTAHTWARSLVAGGG